MPQDVRGRRRKRLTREDVARFNTMVAVRAARFVYFAGSLFAFERDGVIANAPDEWLKRADGDTRDDRKRGTLKIIRGWLGEETPR